MKTAGSISELPDILDLLGKQSSSGPSKADKLLGGGIGAHFCTVLATIFLTIFFLNFCLLLN
jgi:hypothetical protein